MATIDRIIEMQQKGMGDEEISKNLRNEGHSPREIKDSLNQAKIKSAVNAPEQGNNQPGEEMQQSIMQSPPAAPSPVQNMPPTPQNDQQPGGQQFQEQYPPQPQENMPEYQGEQQEQYYQQTPQAYSGQEYYPPQSTTDPETISEIAEQVFQEQFSEIKTKIESLSGLRTEMGEKISDLDLRLKKIESNIDKLQQAIIGKIGEFGENTALIHQDLENLHNTTSKLMNPLVDNYNELKRIAGKE